MFDTRYFDEYTEDSPFHPNENELKEEEIKKVYLTTIILFVKLILFMFIFKY